MSSAFTAVARFAPKILIAVPVDGVFTAVTLVPNRIGSVVRRTSFASMPISSYEPVYQRPHMFFQSRSINRTSRQGLSDPGHELRANPHLVEQTLHLPVWL